MHNNMVTVNGQKMGKSLNNFITLEQFFEGTHPALERAYSPMVIRFFILQAHYRSTVDFSNEALQASEKGLERLHDARKSLDALVPATGATTELPAFADLCYEALNDDLNSPQVIAELFNATRLINRAKNGEISLTQGQIEELKSLFDTFLYQLLGILPVGAGEANGHREAFEGAMELLLSIRQDAKLKKDWATSDKIRDELARIGFEIKDTKEGAEWKLK